MFGALAAGLSEGLGLLREEGTKREDEARRQAEADRKRELDLHDYVDRLKFAEDLQLSMLEKKLQLSQKYPEYSNFVTDPVDGAVTAFTKHGAMSVLREGDPERKKLFYDDLERKKRESLAKEDRYRAQAEASRARAAKDSKGEDAPKNQYDKLSPTQEQTWIENEAKRIDPGAFEKPSIMGPTQIEELAARKTAARRAAEEVLNSRRTPPQVDMGDSGLGAFGVLLNDDVDPSAYSPDDVYNPYKGPLR